MLSFRIPARTYELLLLLFFTTDEINKNPYLLPNMSLMFNIIYDLCKDTLGILDILHTQAKPSSNLMNYDCGSNKNCFILLTGPSWKTSLKLAVYSRTPRVRMCDS